MVFEKVRRKITKTKAKLRGMTVKEFEQYQKRKRAEAKKRKAELAAKEKAERRKFEKWKIEQKYKRKRKQVKSRKNGTTCLLDLLGGGVGTTGREDSISGIFGLEETTKKKRRRRKKRRR